MEHTEHWRDTFIILEQERVGGCAHLPLFPPGSYPEAVSSHLQVSDQGWGFLPCPPPKLLPRIGSSAKG